MVKLKKIKDPRKGIFLHLQIRYCIRSISAGPLGVQRPLRVRRLRLVREVTVPGIHSEDVDESTISQSDAGVTDWRRIESVRASQHVGIVDVTVVLRRIFDTVDVARQLLVFPGILVDRLLDLVRRHVDVDEGRVLLNRDLVAHFLEAIEIDTPVADIAEFDLDKDLFTGTNRRNDRVNTRFNDFEARSLAVEVGLHLEDQRGRLGILSGILAVVGVAGIGGGIGRSGLTLVGSTTDQSACHEQEECDKNGQSLCHGVHLGAEVAHP